MNNTERMQDIYVALRKKLERKPKSKEFFDEEGVNEKLLMEAYGRNAYSKLQEACGDSINKLVLERTSTDKILSQYGELTRDIGELPTQSEWIQRKCKPLPSGLLRPPHNIKWSEMPNCFLEHFGNNSIWKDVVEIIKANMPTVESIKSEPQNKDLDAVLTAIEEWTPRRRRNSEEAYKIELREYFENNANYTVSEETGESNVDIVVNKIIAIELKKSPSLSEYDRLFGQIARHLNSFNYVIALIFDVFSDDRYRSFVRNIDELYGKLNLNVIVLTK